MDSTTQKALARKKKRVLRIRKKVTGNSEKPRLCFVKSNKHITIQVIDDVKGLTLVNETSLSKTIREKNLKKNEIAKLMGEQIAKACLEKGVKRAVLDRRGNKYHGLIAAFADSAREHGLQF